MATQIQCPNCGQTYNLNDQQVPQYAGQTITCTTCQKPFTVAREIAAPASAAAPTTLPHTPESASPQPSYQTPPSFQQPPPGGFDYDPNAPKERNGMAIASLICGILGITGIGGILAIIFGILGVQRTRDPRVGGKGMAIAGIVLGSVMLVAAIPLTCMGSILLPSLHRARETANRVKCASNMRQIGQALLLYANENRGALPPTIDLALATQDIPAEVFNCPSSNETPAPGADNKQQAANLSKPGHNSYIYAGKGFTSSASAETVILYENLKDHTDGGNVLYGDGHVEWFDKRSYQKILDQVPQGKNPPDMRNR